MAVAVGESKKSGASASLKEPNARSFIEWTPNAIRSAFISADGGNMSVAAALCQDMLTDDRIDGVLETLAGVISLPFTFEPGPADGRKSKKVIKALLEDWWEIFPEALLTQVIKWSRIMGVGYAYAPWSFNESRKRFLPELQFWHPRNLVYDLQKHNWIVKVGDAGFDSVPVDLTSGEWWFLQPNGKRRPWEGSPWKGIAPWWILKRHARNDWDQYSLRQGQGIFSAETEINAGATPEERDEIVQYLQNPDKLAAVGLPEGMHLKMVESLAKAHENFERQVFQANTSISISLVGQNLTTEVVQGSLAAAFVHERIENRRLSQLASALSTSIREQILVPYARVNFGDGELAPWPKWDTTPPRDTSEKAAVLKIIGTYVANMAKGGISPNNFDFEKIERFYNVETGLNTKNDLEENNPTVTETVDPNQDTSNNDSSATA